MHGMHGMGAAGPGAEAGQQSAAEAILHAAGLDPLPAAGITQLTPNSAANMRRWAPEVRALLIQQAVARQLGHAVDPAGTHVSLTWSGNALVTLYRPTDATLAPQCDIVRFYADQRGDRSAEVFSQMDAFAAYFGHLLGLTSARNPRTLELLALVPTIAGPATMVPKHVFAVRRPAEIDVRVAALIGTPGHGAFPSGHATQAMALAVVCEALIRANPGHFPDADIRVDLCYRAAQRIAVNRTVAGVHYPMDSAAGARMGLQIGRALVAMGTTGGTLADLGPFDPNLAPGKDYLYEETHALWTATPAGTPIGVEPDPLLGWLWSQAAAEFGL
ncbi:phosphatase PAP2 family protein [Stagnihabitans tardus]|nr:phosphatase PAP2 family protein [Stagnihabitans tardus]